jgi:hypothetical protein
MTYPTATVVQERHNHAHTPFPTCIGVANKRCFGEASFDKPDRYWCGLLLNVWAKLVITLKSSVFKVRLTST